MLEKKESSSCGCIEPVETVSKCPNCNSKGTVVSGATIKAQLKKRILKI